MTNLSREDIDLLRAQAPIGILMPDDETLRLVAVTDGVVEARVGATAESVTANDGIVFWFDASDANIAVNRMATLNLLAVSAFSVRTVPLLRGTVLATGHLAGRPHGLTRDQTKAFQQESEPTWWVNWVMHMREERDRQRRRSLP